MARGRGSLADATGDAAAARGEKGLWNSYPRVQTNSRSLVLFVCCASVGKFCMSKVKITFREHYDNKEKIYENAEAEEDYASQRLGVYRVDAKGKRSKQT